MAVSQPKMVRFSFSKKDFKARNALYHMQSQGRVEMDDPWQLCRTIGPLTFHSQEIKVVKKNSDIGIFKPLADRNLQNFTFWFWCFGCLTFQKRPGFWGDLKLTLDTACWYLGKLINPKINITSYLTLTLIHGRIAIKFSTLLKEWLTIVELITIGNLSYKIWAS